MNNPVKPRLSNCATVYTKIALTALTVLTATLLTANHALANTASNTANDIFATGESEDIISDGSGTDSFLKGISDLVPGANQNSKRAKTKPKTHTMPDPIAMVNTKPVDELGDEAEMLEFETEMAQHDADAYTYFSKQTKAEEARLKSEIVGLERGIRNSKSAAVRAKKQAELADKKLKLQENRRKEASARLAKAESEKRKEERALNKVKAKVTRVEERLETIRSRNRVAQQTLSEMRSENKSLERKLKKVSAQLKAEERKKREMSVQRNRLSDRNRKLKSDLSSLERRLRDRT